LVFSSADSITKRRRKAKKTFGGGWQFQTIFWHVTCGKTGMARNLNRLKVAQAARAQAAVTNRQPAQQAGAFYLMQLRSETQKTSPFRRRLHIAVESGPCAEVPRFVKIIHAG
jgi:hypothetical protein